MRQIGESLFAKYARQHRKVVAQRRYRASVASTLRKDNAPQNLSVLRKIVLNLIRLDTTDKSKARLRLERKGAAWDDEVRMNMPGLTPL